MPAKQGILLINLGTPDAPEKKEIRRYLNEFLSDPRIIDMPFLARKALLNFAILPKRPSKIAPKYKKIWMKEGSPLMVYGEQLRQLLQKDLGETIQVEKAMRYGQPSISKALNKLIEEKVEQILIVPLFPQYASATTGSVYQEVFECLKDQWYIPSLSFLPPFFDHSFYIDSTAKLIEKHQPFHADHLLFSFHSLPETHLAKTTPYHENCLKSPDCCSVINSKNRNCYRAQCHETARLIANSLGLSTDQYSVSFQSRMGKQQWLQPETTKKIQELAEAKVKKLIVCSPSFLIDCLETLEELQIQEKETFLRYGGKEYFTIPSLNADQYWIQSLSQHLKRLIR